MKNNFVDYSYDLAKVQRTSNRGAVLTYDQAMEVIKTHIEKLITEENEELIKKKMENNNLDVKKDKVYLRERKAKFRHYIDRALVSEGFSVQGIDLKTFLNEMVAEFAGYSVLEAAFADPDVSDIFVVSWDLIFVERNGKNAKYHRTFRSAKHFEDVLKRFLREAGKEINSGDSKIVDFELYQDRGNAIHPVVSPTGYTLTMRKHKEDHIKRDDIIRQNVANEKLLDFIGMLVRGESNIICGGITGSGKTTTIRAILDYYVSKANKRMLVCEDTQELFPKNEHTVQMVSVRADNPEEEVSLRKLILTALRLKPKYIVVGEVRGVEAEAAVEGMETGHSTIFTMHAHDPWSAIDRLVTKYIMAMPALGYEVVERIIGGSVDYIFIQDDVPGVGRKITKLSEVTYNFKEHRIEVKTICAFNIKTGDWEWKGKISHRKADKMLRRGIPISEIEPWIEGGEMIYD